MKRLFVHKVIVWLKNQSTKAERTEIVNFIRNIERRMM